LFASKQYVAVPDPSKKWAFGQEVRYNGVGRDRGVFLKQIELVGVDIEEESWTTLKMSFIIRTSTTYVCEHSLYQQESWYWNVPWE
jgi:hypothetical protein